MSNTKKKKELKELEELEGKVVENEVSEEEKELEENVVGEIEKEISEPKVVETGESNINAKKAGSMEDFFNNLTPEGLVRLRDKLAVVPETISEEEKPKTITLKYIDKKIVIDNQDQVKEVFRDQLTGLTKTELFVPVKFYGEEEFTKIPYTEYRDAKRITVEIVKTESKDSKVVQGEVSKVDSEGYQTPEITKIITTHTKEVIVVKLPMGEEVEIGQNAVNA